MANSFFKDLLGTQDPTTYDTTTVIHVVDLLRKTLLGIATTWAIVGLLMIGYKYFTAFGDETKAATAKKTLYTIIIGMIVIILSEVIVYEVQHFLVGSQNQPPPIEKTTNPFTTVPGN